MSIRLSSLGYAASAAMVAGLAIAIQMPVQADHHGSGAAPVADHHAADHHAAMEDKANELGTIVDVAVGAGSFTTLAELLQAAGLVETLQGEGPFTVFAPTDEAFAALPEGTVEALKQPENADVLTQILTYHVVPGEVMSGNITSGAVATIAAIPIQIDVVDGTVMINDATVTTADVDASNGVIHIVDSVLLPPTE
ncbi:MAG: fasciclin domain-containing protein [Leptolyngbyaceae cyanobacterium]